MIVTKKINIKNGYILEILKFNEDFKFKTYNNDLLDFPWQKWQTNMNIFFYPTAVIEFHYNYHTPKRM